MVLRALGLTGGQSRRMLFTQSTLIALVGFVIGIPLGVVSRRAVWRVVAEGTPVQLVVPTAWTVIGDDRDNETVASPRTTRSRQPPRPRHE